MKTKFLLSACLTAGFLAFNLNALADDGGGDGDSQDTNSCDINGLEVMDAFVVLTPTSNAPASATGFAKIDSDDDDGNETASLNLTTIGLDPGDYILSVTLQSTGTNVVLAQFTAPSHHDDGEDGQGDNQGGDGENEDGMRWDGGSQGGGWWCSLSNNCTFSNCFSFPGGMTFTNCFSNWMDWQGFNDWGAWTNLNITNFCPGTNFPVISRTRVDLPAGVNPTDIGAIIVSDTNGNDILVGNITNPAPATVINIQATVQLTPGSGAPGSSGTAQLRSTALKGKWKHQFTLNASGMNARSTFKVNVNGKISGAAKSTKTGQVKITKLPSHTSTLRSLKLLDASGNEAAAAKF